MVVRFGQVIPTGQAVETTEVVSQLDPKFRKVWYGMAGNRFDSLRFSRMLVVRFDSDQAPGQLLGQGAARRLAREQHLPGWATHPTQHSSGCLTDQSAHKQDSRTSGDPGFARFQWWPVYWSKLKPGRIQVPRNINLRF